MSKSNKGTRVDIHESMECITALAWKVPKTGLAGVRVLSGIESEKWMDWLRFTYTMSYWISEARIGML
jgi:hypothetical protein